MRKVILLVCLAALLTSTATVAMASDTQWVMSFRTGNLVGTAMSNGGDLIVGVKDATADTPFTSFIATAANVGSDVGGVIEKTEFQDVDTVGPVLYTYNMKIAVATSYPAGVNQVFITAWAGTKFGLATGYDMPTDYVVTLKKGATQLAQWTQPQLWVGATAPASGRQGPVGFWYTYDSRAASFAESTDIITVEIGPANTPEPGSLLALGSGLVGLAGFAVRRRRA